MALKIFKDTLLGRVPYSNTQYCTILIVGCVLEKISIYIIINIIIRIIIFMIKI